MTSMTHGWQPSAPPTHNGYRSGPSYSLFESAGPAVVRFPSGLALSVTTGPTGDGQRHWDPLNTGQPLLSIPPGVLAQRVSPNFTVRELVSSGGSADNPARISVRLVQLLQAIRDQAQRPVHIRSGYRSWQRNVRVYAGRRPTHSRHCSGEAADISIRGLSGMDIAKIAVDVWGSGLGVGIAAGYAHVDVRPVFTVWTYPDGKRAWIREITDYHSRRRGSVRPASVSVPPAPAPVPVPPAPTPSGGGRAVAGRLVIDRVPLLRQHAGTHPDLVLRWNAMSAPSVLDLVVHLHGYAPDGRGRAMTLPRDKEPVSGLDFADPSGAPSVGRVRPTLAIMPRGNYFGGRWANGYNFPALSGRGTLEQLIQFSLDRFAHQTGIRATRGRLVLTAHSGGGAGLTELLRQVNPDEVHVFDALYAPLTGSDPLVAWAQSAMRRGGTALRVIYRRDGKHSTQHSSEALQRMLCQASGGQLPPGFVVEHTATSHGDIPRRFGWQLLANSTTVLVGTTPLTCSPSTPSTPPAPSGGATTGARAGSVNGQRYVSYGDHIKVGGSRAWRNNNPGNIRPGQFTRANGAIGADTRPGDPGFAIFADEASGMRAIVALLKTSTYRNLTIAGVITRYAPPSENDTRRYIEGVVTQTGLAAGTVISRLTDAQLAAIAQAIRRMEGQRRGQEYTCADAPAWARPLLVCTHERP
jgi:Peptidase M15